jgi:hypothetical protein
LCSEAVAITRAPIALAIWMAAVPTPEAPAWMNAQRPEVSPPWTIKASKAVRKASGIAAASGRPTASGTAIT